MRIAIAILTWNRLTALKNVTNGLKTHCDHHALAIFEDGGLKDETIDVLRHARKATVPELPRPDLEAIQINTPNGTVFLGTENLGVAGNSNRALRWFMRDTRCDYLCLCNDDITVKGDFATFYADAWQKTGVGLFCFCGFTDTQFAFDVLEPVNGIQLKSLGRLTGAVMAMPRKLIEHIGYFDLRFGKFGEEHCDYTSRAKLAGFQEINGKVYNGLDVVHDLLAHADFQSSMQGQDKQNADYTASTGVSTIDYIQDGLWRPYQLFPNRIINGTDNTGIEEARCHGYWDLVAKEQVTF